MCLLFLQMRMRECVSGFVYVHVCALCGLSCFTCVCVCGLYVCVLIGVYVYVYMSTHVQVYVFVYVCICMCMHVDAFMCIVYVYVHAYTQHVHRCMSTVCNVHWTCTFWGKPSPCTLTVSHFANNYETKTYDDVRPAYDDKEPGPGLRQMNHHDIIEVGGIRLETSSSLLGSKKPIMGLN